MRGRELQIGKLSEKERGYLFGLFEGDGYRFHDKKSRHYHVEFYLNSRKDKDIINYLVGLLKKINLSPSLYQDKRFNCMRIRVYSKDLFSIIKKQISLEDQKKEFGIGFISGLIDSEGYYNKNKSYIMVINTNLKILEDSQKFLKKMRISSSISKRKPSKKDRSDSYRMYISVNFKNVPNLSLKTKRLQ